MLRQRGAAALAAALAVAGAGCGFGPGSRSEGVATLTVTRDYGAESIASASESDPRASETALRMLDRETDITTRYGGGFVQSINGISGTTDGSRTLDWFFYVDGIESEVGSAERSLSGGDRVWWDYRDWTDAMRVPAVVGSWPEPFAQASAADPKPVAIECHGEEGPCATVRDRLADVGVEARVEPSSAAPGALRLIVGNWRSIRNLPEAELIARGPAASGVFARFSPDGSAIEQLTTRAVPVSRETAGAGLLAATRDGDDPPVWLVTGTDPAGVESAASALESGALSNRYAVATGPGGVTPLPAVEGGSG